MTEPLPPLRVYPEGWRPPLRWRLSGYGDPNVEQLFRQRGAQTAEQVTRFYRSVIARSQAAIRTLEQQRQIAELLSEPTARYQWWIDQMRNRIRDARYAIMYVGQRPTTGGTPTAVVGAGGAAAAGAGTAIAGSSGIGWGARAGRVAAGLTAKGIIVIGVALLAGGAGYFISRSFTGDGETQRIAAIGPVPDDPCIVEIAEEKGLVWSDESGWDIGGRERPDPDRPPYDDDAALYRRDRDDYLSTVNGLVYEAFQEAGTRCAAGGGGGQCTESSYTGRVTAASADGRALAFADVESNVTASIGSDCRFSIWIFWVAETRQGGDDTPLCYAVLGGGDGEVDPQGNLTGGHTVNAGNFTPRPGRAAQTCAALVAEGNVGQYLGQRGSPTGISGNADPNRIDLTLSTGVDQGPPHMVLTVLYQRQP